MQRKRAFSLLELAIALMITGMVAGMVMKLSTTTDRNECYAASKAQVTKIKEAIDRFALSNRRFPLPARRYVGTDSPLYGKEVKPGEITDLDSVTNNGTIAVFGTVPYAALGLTMDDAIDCWGNRLTYVVTEALTTQDGFTNETEGAITISVAQNARISTKEPGTPDGFGYAVIVHGEDQLGAVKANWSDYTAATLPPATTEADRLAKRKWCPADTSLKSRNCSADSASQGNLMAAPFNNGNDPTTYFDDVIIFKGKPWVKESGGKVYCWGDGSGGQLGNTTNTPYTYSPVEISSTELFTYVTGSQTKCAITNTGKLYCWGEGNDGELGNGGNVASNFPVLADMPAGSVVTQVAVGSDSVCALTAGEGKIYCWGSDSSGQLGNGTGGGFGNKNRPFPVNTSNLVAGEKFTKLASKGTTYCGITTLGNIYCWGEGSEGEIGNKNTNDVQSPTRTQEAPSTLFFNRFSSDSFTSYFCAITNTNKPYCWGANVFGSMGIGGSTSGIHTVDEPLAINSPLFKKLYHSWDLSCGIDTNDNARCWGKGTHGQQGNGLTANRSSPNTPNPVTDGTTVLKFKSLFPARTHVCGITDKGRAYCWGQNDVGQLGNAQLKNGGTLYKTTASLVAGDLTFAQSQNVTMGAGTAASGGVCMVTTQGRVYCWGNSAHTAAADTPSYYNDYPTPLLGSDLTAESVPAFSFIQGSSTKCAIAGKPPKNSGGDWGVCTGPCGEGAGTQQQACGLVPATLCPTRACTRTEASCLSPMTGHCDNPAPHLNEKGKKYNENFSGCPFSGATYTRSWRKYGIRGGGNANGCFDSLICP